MEPESDISPESMKFMDIVFRIWIGVALVTVAASCFWMVRAELSSCVQFVVSK